MPEEYTVRHTAAEPEKVRALSIDIAKVLQQNPKAIAINLFYVVKGDDVEIKGMEIVSPAEQTVS